MNNVPTNLITINDENYFITKDKILVDLNRSINLNKKLLSHKRARREITIRKLVETIYDQLDIKSPNNLKLRKINALDCILSNVMEAHSLKCVVRVSRDKEHYRKSKPFKIKHYTHSIMINCMDALIKNGYIEIALGYHDAENKVSKRSKIWATNKLLDELEIVTTPFSMTEALGYESTAQSCINFDSIGFNYKETYDKQPVVLKGKKKAVNSNKGKGNKSKVAEVLLFKPDRTITKMQEDIHAYNTMMDSVDVTIQYQYYIEDYSDPMVDIIYHPVDEAVWYINGLDKIRHTSEEDLDLVNNNNNQCKLNERYLATSISDRNSIYRNREYTTSSSYTNGYYRHAHNDFHTITQSIRYKLFYEKKLRPYLYRVFNNGTFNDGGRFYGAQYQQLNSEQRSHIFIDSMPTIELDYKALHPTMLYHSLGIEVTTDPYDLFDGNQLLRKATKLMFNMALNAPSEYDAQRAFNSKLYDFKPIISTEEYDQDSIKIKQKRAIINELKKNDLKAKDILTRIKEVHPDFKDFLGTGYGLKLQNKDSMMAAEILNHFTSKRIPCLCIHDSFIVQFNHADELEEVMKATYSKYNNGFDCIVEM